MLQTSEPEAATNKSTSPVTIRTSLALPRPAPGSLLP
jgi:hypothetical protein